MKIEGPALEKLLEEVLNAHGIKADVCALDNQLSINYGGKLRDFLVFQDGSLVEHPQVVRKEA